MKRLLQLIFNALTILSLLLCLATIVLWARSYLRAESATFGYWGYRNHPGFPDYFDAWQFEAFNTPGRWIARVHLCACVAGPGRFENAPHQKGKILTIDLVSLARLRDAQSSLSTRSTRIYGPSSQTRRHTFGISFSHAATAATLALLPAINLIRALRRRHVQNKGLCEFCGYDLRATPDRCPECGAIPAKPLVQAAPV